MNLEHIKEALRASIDQNQNKAGEEKLKQMKKIIGFVPVLLDVIDDSSAEVHVRQAAAVFMKNTIIAHWSPPEPKNPTPENSFSIHEQDKHVLRQRIIDSLVAAPVPIGNQLSQCCKAMLEHDFPQHWPTAVDKIVVYLNEPTDDARSSQAEKLYGALVALYALVKNYEYKQEKEREPLTAAMQIILPVMLERMGQLRDNQLKEAVLIKKLLLKILFALVQYSFSLSLMPQDSFVKWMEHCRIILESSVPEEQNQVELEERPELVWWKCKKWAIHLLHRIFERYGNPATAAKPFTAFATYYVRSCAPLVIKTILSLFDRNRGGEFISGRVVHEMLLYLAEGTGHSFTWKVMKEHVLGVVRDVVFIYLCHSDEDNQLWQEDPQEYIRVKYDMYEELRDPSHAGIVLLNRMVRRKGQLPLVLAFLNEILTAEQASDEMRDGALHTIGALSEVLGKKKQYKPQLELMLATHILPVIENPLAKGFLKARACWVVKEYAQIQFADPENLRRALALTVATLSNSQLDLPIRMEAAMAVQELQEEQERVATFLKPEVKHVITSLLDLIALTRNDDLCTAMNTFITDFMEDVIPVSVDIANHLVRIFMELMNSTPTEEGDYTMAATGILSTLETVLDTVEDHPQIMAQLETVVRGLVQWVFSNSLMDFYEEMLTLVYSLTCSHISPAMWEIFDAMFALFGPEGGVEYFTDMMPALHNFVTVDTEAFLTGGDGTRVEKVLAMCRHVFDAEFDDEDNELHAAKMIEIVVLQCRGRIDGYVQPIVQLVLTRLAKEMKTSELRTMCLEVLIAILHYNPAVLLGALSALQPADSTQPLLDVFVTKWLDDTDCFLGVHDRKICILGLLILINMEPRPQCLLNSVELRNQILPACILLFDGLQRAYHAKAEREKAEQEEDGEDAESVEEDDLADDDDEIDEDAKQYMEMLTKMDKDSGNGDEFESESDDESYAEEDMWESYVTPLDGPAGPDEYVAFKDTLQAMESSDPSWLHSLCAPLTAEQQTKLQEIFSLADQRRAAATSRQIENRGGYQFNVQQVPTAFNFGQ